MIVLGVSVPLVVNILGTFKIIPMSIYVTPITFTVTIICCAIAILKFQFLGVTPIALQKIVDRISDGYVVLDENNTITDFNKTFLDIFRLKAEDIRSKNFIKLLQSKNVNRQAIVKIDKSIEKANESYYLLKKTPTPTVIVECGFLSNQSEAELLNEETYQDKVAYAVMMGILRYLTEL